MSKSKTQRYRLSDLDGFQYLGSAIYWAFDRKIRSEFGFGSRAYQERLYLQSAEIQNMLGVRGCQVLPAKRVDQLTLLDLEFDSEHLKECPTLVPLVLPQDFMNRQEQLAVYPLIERRCPITSSHIDRVIVEALFRVFKVENQRVHDPLWEPSSEETAAHRMSYDLMTRFVAAGTSKVGHAPKGRRFAGDLDEAALAAIRISLTEGISMKEAIRQIEGNLIRVETGGLYRRGVVFTGQGVSFQDRVYRRALELLDGGELCDVGRRDLEIADPEVELASIDEETVW